MMPQVINGIQEQSHQIHTALKTGVPPGRIVHRRFPIGRARSIEPGKNGAMDLIEFADDPSRPKQSRSAARSYRINEVKEWGRYIECLGEDAGAQVRQMVEQHQKPSEGHHENESEKDVKNNLAIGPAGVPTRLSPLALRDRGHHRVKLASHGL
jgi:hypothetical protein